MNRAALGLRNAVPAVPASLAAPLEAAMRVLYVNYEWDLREASGAATHMRELTGALRSLGHAVVVCDRHRSPEPVENGRRTAPTGAALRRRLSPYLHEWAALARAVKGIRVELAIMRKVQPDVVLTRYSLHQFSSLLAARRLGVPVVLEVNAPLAFEYRHYLRQYRLMPGFAEWSEARLLTKAAGVFVVSSLLKDYFVERGVPAERIGVIPNGVDTNRFRPDAADPALRARFGNDRILIGFVGSFASFHGSEALRQAIVEVLPRRKDVVLVLVGDGPLADELKASCRAAGVTDRVVFTGFLPPGRVPGVMAAMDVLLAPYAAHGLFYFSSLKLLEYMACGRAVIAPRVGQIAEVIEDGKNGLLYEPHGAGGLERPLLDLLDDAALRARLGANARRTVQAQYTWRTNAERVGAVLRGARQRYGARVQ